MVVSRQRSRSDLRDMGTSKCQSCHASLSDPDACLLNFAGCHASTSRSTSDSGPHRPSMQILLDRSGGSCYKKESFFWAPSLLRSLWSSPYSPSSASLFGDSRMGSGSPPGRSLVVGERRDGGPPPKVEGRRPSTSCEVRWEGSAVVPGGLRPPHTFKDLPRPRDPPQRAKTYPTKAFQATFRHRVVRRVAGFVG